MTEHTRIPLPDRAEDDRSLFERASGSFGLEPFRPAPMPRALPEPPIKTARPVQKAGEPAPAAPAAQPPASVPERRMAPIEQPVRFAGAVHPIDRERLRDRGMIVPEDGATAMLEEFRIVKRQLIAAAHAAGDDDARRVLVSSPLPGDGKTFCAINLAIAMAGEQDGEVLLIDGDIAKPSIPARLGLPKGPGLMDALADPALRVEDLVLATDIHGLFVLPAGGQSARGSEWLASERTAAVLERLTRGAPRRMIVFDSPPALAASPAADLARHVGQVVLVARADRTGRTALEDAIDLLAACPDIKLLLNGARFSPSGRRFGSYYGSEE